MASLLIGTLYTGVYQATLAPTPARQATVARTSGTARKAAHHAHRSAASRDAESSPSTHRVSGASLGASQDLQFTGAGSFAGGTACTQLLQTAAAFEEKGYHLGIYAIDLGTGDTLAYDPDAAFYTASAIKGPYVTSLFSLEVEKGTLSLDDALASATPIILNSDNDTYVALSDARGRQDFLAWLQSADVSTGAYLSLDDYARPHYPLSTARQLAQEWQASYAYLTSGTTAAKALQSLFANRVTSPIRDALGASHQTWSKAGWYPTAEGDARPATNDAGVVWGTGGPYVVAILSDAPEDFSSVQAVATSIDAAMADLTSRGSAS
ncbi:MAG: serine hydrolase [Parafannyhessea sp.]|uniref:serine hydrolase n=1 Tax=Parafannyhessea sp. TaxID=2847324 RepID=UPI003F03E8EC